MKINVVTLPFPSPPIRALRVAYAANKARETETITRPTAAAADLHRVSVESCGLLVRCLHPVKMVVTAPRIMQTTVNVAIRWLIGCMFAYSYMKRLSPEPGYPFQVPRSWFSGNWPGRPTYRENPNQSPTCSFLECGDFILPRKASQFDPFTSKNSSRC